MDDNHPIALAGLDWQTAGITTIALIDRTDD
jgi:hypothetical protein